MNLFTRLLGRASALRAPATHPPRRASRAIPDTIDRALRAAGLEPAATAGIRDTIDGALAQAGLGAGRTGARTAPHAPGASAILEPAAAGAFATRAFSNDAGTRSYKLYIPTGYAGDAEAPVPLLVMLHGCTQSPDDFAAGTRMNQLADAHGFLVAYPAQAQKANGSKCWNWFRAGDQARDRGEPSLLAGIARQVASDYRVDRRRVYVAGLSAGAAMAVILGSEYPEVFAAVGAHSGLPFAAAHDVSSAFTAMKAGPPGARTRQPAGCAVPTIVFHGDADHTVAASNGRAIAAEAAGTSALHATGQQDGVAGARAYTREVLADASGRPRVEHWLIHGAAHAWSGGSTEGSYTDPAGPDASAEMVRFFLQHQLGAC